VTGGRNGIRLVTFLVVGRGAYRPPGWNGRVAFEPTGSPLLNA